jgi:hypothetical protein
MAANPVWRSFLSPDGLGLADNPRVPGGLSERCMVCPMPDKPSSLSSCFILGGIIGRVCG